MDRHRAAALPNISSVSKSPNTITSQFAVDEFNDDVVDRKGPALKAQMQRDAGEEKTQADCQIKDRAQGALAGIPSPRPCRVRCFIHVAPPLCSMSYPNCKRRSSVLQSCAIKTSSLEEKTGSLRVSGRRCFGPRVVRVSRACGHCLEAHTYHPRNASRGPGPSGGGRTSCPILGGRYQCSLCLPRRVRSCEGRSRPSGRGDNRTNAFLSFYPNLPEQMPLDPRGTHLFQWATNLSCCPDPIQNFLLLECRICESHRFLATICFEPIHRMAAEGCCVYPDDPSLLPCMFAHIYPFPHSVCITVYRYKA